MSGAQRGDDESCRSCVANVAEKAPDVSTIGTLSAESRAAPSGGTETKLVDACFTGRQPAMASSNLLQHHRAAACAQATTAQKPYAWDQTLQRFPSLLRLYPLASFSEADAGDEEDACEVKDAVALNNPNVFPDGFDANGDAVPNDARCAAHGWEALRLAQHELWKRDRAATNRESALEDAEARNEEMARQLADLQRQLEKFGQELEEGILALAAHQRVLQDERSQAARMQASARRMCAAVVRDEVMESRLRNWQPVL